MLKTCITRISIFISILYIIYLVCDYYGLPRYSRIKRNHDEHLINNYSKLRKASKKKVVLSINTSPDNIKNIRPMLDSLLDQTVKVDQIVLNVVNEKEYNIPEDYKKYMTVFESIKDYNECQSIIPTLMREKETDTIIICINDNQIYGKDFVEFLVSRYDNNPLKSNGILLFTPNDVNPDIMDNKKYYDLKWAYKNMKEPNHLKYTENYKI